MLIISYSLVFSSTNFFSPGITSPIGERDLPARIRPEEGVIFDVCRVFYLVAIGFPV
jgi:hypothetical protein